MSHFPLGTETAVLVEMEQKNRRRCWEESSCQKIGKIKRESWVWLIVKPSDPGIDRQMEIMHLTTDMAPILHVVYQRSKEGILS